MKYFLEFAINSKKFVVPIDEVIEVARPKVIQKRTDKQKNFMGSFKLRHETLYVVDLASVLKMKGGRGNEIIVAEIGGCRIGFCVDQIFGIIEHEQIKSVPDMVGSHRSLTGMLTLKGTIIPIVSLSKAVTKANLSTIKNSVQSKNKK